MKEEKKIISLEYAGKSSFLLPDPSLYSPGEHKLLNNCSISCLCECLATRLNGVRQLIYMTEALRSFADMMGQVKAHGAAALVSSIVKGISDVMKYDFLSLKNIDASSEHIFADPRTYSVYFIYLPLNGGFYKDRHCFEQALRTNITRSLMEKEFFEDPECIRVLSLLQDLFIPPECGLPEKTAKAESAGSKVLRMRDLSGTVKESTVNDSTVNAGISCLANTAGRITAAAGIMLRGEGRSAGISFIIDRDKFIIGRSSDADGVIKANRALGRRHFSILRMDSSYAIQDLGSVNGTFLNKKRLAVNVPEVVRDKDVIAAAGEIFQVMYMG